MSETFSRVREAQRGCGRGSGGRQGTQLGPGTASLVGAQGGEAPGSWRVFGILTCVRHLILLLLAGVRGNLGSKCVSLTPDAWDLTGLHSYPKQFPMEFLKWEKSSTLSEEIAHSTVYHQLSVAHQSVAQSTRNVTSTSQLAYCFWECKSKTNELISWIFWSVIH